MTLHRSPHQRHAGHRYRRWLRSHPRRRHARWIPNPTMLRSRFPALIWLNLAARQTLFGKATTGEPAVNAVRILFGILVMHATPNQVDKAANSRATSFDSIDQTPPVPPAPRLPLCPVSDEIGARCNMWRRAITGSQLIADHFGANHLGMIAKAHRGSRRHRAKIWRRLW